MKHILFVDDDENALNDMRRILQTSQDRWDMVFAAGAEAALLALKGRSFDVVITNFRMRGMDGAQLLGHVRDQYPAAARILLSGHSEVALAARAVPVAHRVVAKPCSAAEITDAVERVCTLQEVFCTPALRDIVGSIGELPSMSTTYMALSNALGDSASPLSAIAKIIERDMAMSAKTLQLVNSAFFGVGQRVTSLSDAVRHLGLDTIKNLALHSETFKVFVPDARIPRTFCASLQRHAHHTAVIAGRLPLAREIREVTLVAALLHDVGTLVLASSMPDEFCAVLARMKEQGCSQAEAEQELLGITHAEIGAYLLGLWGIHNMAVEAIAHHHRPTRINHAGMDCSAAVYLASLLASELEIHPNDLEGQELTEAQRSELEALGLLAQFPEFRKSAFEALNEPC